MASNDSHESGDLRVDRPEHLLSLFIPDLTLEDNDRGEYTHLWELLLSPFHCARLVVSNTCEWSLTMMKVFLSD